MNPDFLEKRSKKWLSRSEDKANQTSISIASRIKIGLLGDLIAFEMPSCVEKLFYMTHAVWMPITKCLGEGFNTNGDVNS